MAKGTAGALSDWRKWRQPLLAAPLPAALSPAWVLAPTAAATMRSSVTSLPVRVSTTRPRDMTMTLSHRPSSSEASEELTMTGVPEPETSRRMR